MTVKQAKEKPMQWNSFCMLAKTPLVWKPELHFFLSCISGKSILVCKYYSLFGRKSAPILINCIHEYLLFTARLNGNLLHLLRRKEKKKTVKENVQKNDFLVNMESTLLLAFVKPERH